MDLLQLTWYLVLGYLVLIATNWVVYHLNLRFFKHVDLHYYTGAIIYQWWKPWAIPGMLRTVWYMSSPGASAALDVLEAQCVQQERAMHEALHRVRGRYPHVGLIVGDYIQRFTFVDGSMEIADEEWERAHRGHVWANQPRILAEVLRDNGLGEQCTIIREIITDAHVTLKRMSGSKQPMHMSPTRMLWLLRKAYAEEYKSV